MSFREKLEAQQIWVYVLTLIIGASLGIYAPAISQVDRFIDPVIAILLYSMFCQIPFLDLKQSFQNRPFFKSLLFSNFVFIPIFALALSAILPGDTVILLGVFLVLLTPCIDYVIVFTHLGKGDSSLVLASTPILFLLQMLLLPFYLWMFLGAESLSVIEVAPFVKSFLFLIAIPFSLAILTQFLSRQNALGRQALNFSAYLPVPLMALTLFVVIASQIGTLISNPTPIMKVLPVYVLFAIGAPALGWLSSKIFGLDRASSIAVVFSSSTRNSLVVLPMALALPSPVNTVAAVVIVTQTLVELVAELIYIKVIPLVITGRKLDREITVKNE